MIDAGGNDPDPFGIRPVQPHELTCLLGRRREDHVGLADHPLFPAEALGGLRSLPASERVVLHLAERVERGHQRNAEDLLRSPSDPAGQPVVAVNDVVAVAFLSRHAQHPAEELR